MSALRRALGSRRRAAVATAAAATVLAVVLANQPHDAAPRSAVAAVTRTPAPTPAVRAGRQDGPPMRVLHDRIAFREAPGIAATAPRTGAAEGILVDVDDRTVLWSLDPHRPRAPASTTKILSALVALENFAPDQDVTVTRDALTQAGDETVMGIHAGERLTVRELLSGMLLVSGNDAATALAVDTAGMPAFVNAMNRQLAALGLQDSHFTTPVGLDDPQMRASAYDLAAVAVADVTSFSVFDQIVTSPEIVLPASGDHPLYDLWNLNRLLQLYPAATGIKPGWTGDAGPCLVGMAERDGHRLIAVLMNDPTLYTDERALLDWGFTQEGLPPLVTPSPTPRPAHRP